MTKSHCSIPSPKKIDPYYDRMIDLYKAKVEQLQAELAECREEEKRLRDIESRAVDMQIKANLAADHKTYDIIQTILSKP